MTNISCRILSTTEDIDAANSFYNSYYQKNRSREQFEWEFLNGPAGKSIYILAFDGEELIGTVCGIPFFIEHRGQLIRSAKVEDLLITEQYRGHGLFQKMMDLLLKTGVKNNIQCFWAFTYATRSFHAAGFVTPWNVNLGIYCINPLKLYKHLQQTSQASALKLIAFSALSWIQAIRRSSYKKILESYSIDERPTQSLTDLLKKQQETFFLQSHEFLTWRMYENPYLRSIRSFELRDLNNILSGHVFINYQNDGVAHWIQNTFAVTVPHSIRKTFICYVISIIQKNNNLIRYWGFNFNSTHATDLQLMKDCGFLFTGRGIPFVWLDVNSNIQPASFTISRMASQGTI